MVVCLGALAYRCKSVATFPASAKLAKCRTKSTFSHLQKKGHVIEVEDISKK